MYRRTLLVVISGLAICIHVGCFKPVWKRAPNRLPTRDYEDVSTPTLHAKLALMVSIVGISMVSFAPDSVLAIAQQYKLPPIDKTDINRCTLTSSSMGQANAARDKLYDLRECDLTKQSAANKDMSGMLASNADFSGVNFKEAQISK